MQVASMIPAPRSSIVESEELLGEELFLYDQASGAVHTLSSGAAMIWMLCDGARDLASITEEIRSASQISTELILPQVQEAVAQFQTLGLLEG